MDGEKLDENIWGPAPTRERMLEVAEWTDNRSREVLYHVIDQCTTTGSARIYFGVDDLGLQEKIRTREVPGIEVGGPWVPKWLFVETDDGYEMDQEILGLWEKYKKYNGARIFCEVLTSVPRQDYFDGKTPLEVLREGSDAEKEMANNYIEQAFNPPLTM